MAKSKSNKVFLIIDFIVIGIVLFTVIVIGIFTFINDNLKPRTEIEKALEAKYHRDFQIISIEKRRAKNQTGSFWAKYHYYASVKDKETGKIFEARKEEKSDKIVDKYMSNTFE